MLRDNYLTGAEVAEILGKTPGMIAKLCQTGKLPGAEKMGKTWIIPKIAVKKYVPEKPGPKPRKSQLAAERAALLTEAGKAKGE